MYIIVRFNLWFRHKPGIYILAVTPPGEILTKKTDEWWGKEEKEIKEERKREKRRENADKIKEVKGVKK